MHWRGKFLLLCLLGLIASTIDGRAQSWRKHVYKADSFEIEFSGAVEVRPSQISEEAKARLVRSTNYIQDAGNAKYQAAATLTKSGVNFEKGVEAGFASYKCNTLLGDTAVYFPAGRGRELRGTNCADGLQAEVRYFATGNWFYQVIALYKKDAGSEAAARNFLLSFKFLGP